MIIADDLDTRRPRQAHVAAGGWFAGMRTTVREHPLASFGGAFAPCAAVARPIRWPAHAA